MYRCKKSEERKGNGDGRKTAAGQTKVEEEERNKEKI
jgi:hypothetical protein